MQEHFKSALNRIKADEALVSKTEKQLSTALAQGHCSRTKLIGGRINAMRKLALVACLALLLMGGGYGYAIPTAYLSVDINPSVELGINTFGRVVSVKAYNDEGAAILSGIDVKGRKVKQAVSQIVDAAADNGFFEADGSSVVLLTAATDNPQQADKLTGEAAAGTKSALAADEAAAAVSQAAISAAYREAAIKAAGISPGKMNLLQKLWEATNGTAATASDYNKILELATDTFKGNGKTYADYPVKDIMAAIKAARSDQKLGATSATGSTVGDVEKPAKGNSSAPGQQLKKDEHDVDKTNKSGQGTANAPGQQLKISKDAVDLDKVKKNAPDKTAD